MSRRVPRVVPWRSEIELNEIKQNYFYGGDRRRALSMAKVLESRGALPPSIEATSLLISALTDDTPESDSYAVRCAYSMALIRFVNGQLDAFQRSQMAIPLHKLAQLSQLPSFFVELRHTATHEGLPSLEFLRESTHRALDWLWQRYWQENNYEERTLDVEENKLREQIKESFRAWRRLRRSDPLKEYKKGDTTPEGLQYWELIRSFEEYKEKDEQSLLFVMYNQNVLVPQGKDGHTKTNGAIKLFAPLIDQLNVDGFAHRLAEHGLSILNATEVDFVPKAIGRKNSQGSNAAAAIVEWLKYLLTPRKKRAEWLDVEEFTRQLLQLPRPWNVELLSSRASSDGKLAKLIDEMAAQCESTPTATPKRKLNEVESEIRSFKKRLQSSEKDTVAVASQGSWTVVAEWTPRCLGVL